MMAKPRGQSTLEWSILMAAMVAAMLLTRSYVTQAMRANIKSTEMQLNGAMQENRP